jgi:DNA processing protein
MDQVLLYFNLKYKGNWDKIYDALEHKERIEASDLEDIEKRINCKYITILDKRYPNNLRMSYRPPFVLFYEGDINLLYRYYDTVALFCDENPNVTGPSIESICDETAASKYVILTNYETGSGESIINYCNAKKIKAISFLSGPIYNSFLNHTALKTLAHNGGLVISECYENLYSDENDDNFSFRVVSGLTDNVILVNIPLNRSWMTTIKCIKIAGSHIYGVNSDESTALQLERCGVTMVDKYTNILETI